MITLRQAKQRTEQPNTSKNSNSSTQPVNSSADNSKSLSITLVRKLSTRWDLQPGWENSGLTVTGKRDGHSVPVVQAGRHLMETSEGHPVSQVEKKANRAHGYRARVTAAKAKAPGKAAKGKVKQLKSAQKAYWARMTREERQAEMKRRGKVARKRGSPMAFDLKVGKEKRVSHQKVYVARSRAKAKGLPLPPLPSEGAAAA